MPVAVFRIGTMTWRRYVPEVRQPNYYIPVLRAGRSIWTALDVDTSIHQTNLLVLIFKLTEEEEDGTHIYDIDGVKN